jgi:hypothetical protein
MKRACHGGDEHDAFSRWRHVTRYRPGRLGKIKRGASKRERRTAKAVIGKERSEER